MTKNLIKILLVAIFVWAPGIFYALSFFYGCIGKPVIISLIIGWFLYGTISWWDIILSDKNQD